MKLLKKKILFTLSFGTDFFKTQQNFLYYNYDFLYQRLAIFRPSSIRVACGELIKNNNIDKIIKNETPFFRLTSRGREKLLSFFPFYLRPRGKWDKTWRIVILKTAQGNQKSKLRTLRTLLQDSGFRKFSRGVYLSPWPISEKIRVFLLEGAFSAKVAVIESKNFLFMDHEQITKEIWQLNSLMNGYYKLINQIRSLLRRKNGQNSLTLKEKREFSLISDSYFSLLTKDPGLPRKLLPADWPAKLAQEAFLSLTRLIKGT